MLVIAPQIDESTPRSTKEDRQRRDNFASRMVLGGTGMTTRAGFMQQGSNMVEYECDATPSVANPLGPPVGAWR